MVLGINNVVTLVVALTLALFVGAYAPQLAHADEMSDAQTAIDSAQTAIDDAQTAIDDADVTIDSTDAEAKLQEAVDKLAEAEAVFASSTGTTTYAEAETLAGEAETLAGEVEGLLVAEEDEDTSDIEALLETLRGLLAQVATLQSELNKIRGEVKSVIKDGLVEGMTDEDIKKIQELLATDSDIYPEGLVTGYFGNLTKQALKRLQARHGAPQTGEIDQATRDLLEEYLHNGFGDRIPPGLLRAPGILKKVEEGLCDDDRPGKGRGPLCKMKKDKDDDDDDDANDDDGANDDDSDTASSTAQDAIDDAQDAIDDAQDAIDASGDDTTDAEALLDEAQTLLDEAQAAFDADNFGTAKEKADDAKDKAEEAEDAV